VYAVLPGPMSWLRHATDALEPLGCAPVDPGMSMVARPNGWAVSVRHDGEELTAVTLFATSDSLPADPSVEEQWVIGMSVDERRLHSLRVAAAATVSRTPGRRYRMLAWNYTRSGLFSRAVSLHSGDVLVDR
jgi:hypothetical protein